MEDPPASECAAADRRHDDRHSVCNDIGLDGERKYQSIRESESRCRQVRTRRFSIHT